MFECFINTITFTSPTQRQHLGLGTELERKPRLKRLTVVVLAAVGLAPGPLPLNPVRAGREIKQKMQTPQVVVGASSS